MIIHSKTCRKWPLKNILNIGFRDGYSLNAGQQYSAILLTCIKLLSVFKNFLLSIFEWPLKTGFTGRPGEHFVGIHLHVTYPTLLHYFSSH